MFGVVWAGCSFRGSFGVKSEMIRSGVLYFRGFYWDAEMVENWNVDWSVPWCGWGVSSWSSVCNWRSWAYSNSSVSVVTIIWFAGSFSGGFVVESKVFSSSVLDFGGFYRNA